MTVFTQAQTIQVTGKVINDSNQALQGVTVLEIKSGKTVITDENGNFKIAANL